jgi:uncharacterized protein
VIGADGRAGNDTEGAQQRVRQCAVSRAHKPPEQLIRFVAAPDGTIVPDLARRLPGRGVWIDATAAAVANAVRQKAFARSLKRPVVVAADLPQQIERLLVRRLAGALGMANKAGLIVTGFAKVERRLREGRVFVLMHAAEASAAEATRLDRLFMLPPGAGGAEGQPAARIVQELTSAELSLAMGRPTVVHAAAAEGGASRQLLAEARRLRRYRSGEAATAPQRRPKGAGNGEGQDLDQDADQDPGQPLVSDPDRDTSPRHVEAGPAGSSGAGSTGNDSTRNDSARNDSTGTDGSNGQKRDGHESDQHQGQRQKPRQR